MHGSWLHVTPLGEAGDGSVMSRVMAEGNVLRNCLLRTRWWPWRVLGIFPIRQMNTFLISHQKISFFTAVFFSKSWFTPICWFGFSVVFFINPGGVLQRLQQSFRSPGARFIMITLSTYSPGGFLEQYETLGWIIWQNDIHKKYMNRGQYCWTRRVYVCVFFVEILNTVVEGRSALVCRMYLWGCLISTQFLP